MICVRMMPPLESPGGQVSSGADGAGEVPAHEHEPRGLIDAQTRHDMILRAAYSMAECRGFEPGHELEDWLAAERQIDAAIACGAPRAFW